MATSKQLGLDAEWQLPVKEVEEARLKAKTETEDNYLGIKIKFYELVVPYNEGVKIVAALSKAEFISDEIAWDYQKIVPIDARDYKIETRLISKIDYINMKMRHLLNIQSKPMPF